MAQNSDASSDAPKLSAKVKTLFWQATIGTISLTAAAVIPLLVQRFMQPVPVTTPASVVPTALPADSQIQPPPQVPVRVQPVVVYGDDDDDD